MAEELSKRVKPGGTHGTDPELLKLPEPDVKPEPEPAPKAKPKSRS